MFKPQVFNIVGLSWIMLGISMLFSVTWSIYFSEPDLWPVIKSSVITFLLGLTTFTLTYKKNKMI